MRKPPDLPFKRFDARLTGLNNYLPIFPGSNASNNMSPEELNEIILQTVLNVWSKKSYLQGWGFEGKTYKGTCDMFECMDIAEQVYKGGTPSKPPIG